jgi:hypothetical protein
MPLMQLHRPLKILKHFLPVACLAALMSLATSAHAQAAPAAEISSNMQIGGGWSIANPDYNTAKTQGFTIYGDLDFRRHLGLEGDIHRASMIMPNGVGIDSYIVGPRYTFHRNRLNPYVKAMWGIGRFKEKDETGAINTYTYKMTFAFGGGLDYLLMRRVNVRAFDFEYQDWPGFKPNGLSPYIVSFGAAYAF